MNEIHVTSQNEFDKIPEDYKGKIIIDSGKIIVGDVFHVTAKGNSYVMAMDHSYVESRGNSFVEAWDYSHIVASENSHVEARGFSYIEATENSSVIARENSRVVTWKNSHVVAQEKSSVVAWGTSVVTALDNSRVRALEASFVKAWDNSYIVAKKDSSVVAGGNSQVFDETNESNIEVFGNARIIRYPRNVHEYINLHGTKHTENTAVFYKAVHKDNEGYYSDHDSNFRYNIGETIFNVCDQNTEETCGIGIHISHLDWALDFGGNFENLAILELEVPINKIVVPKNTSGKARTSEVKVLREIPLEECGDFGKILAKKQEYQYFT